MPIPGKVDLHKLTAAFGQGFGLQVIKTFHVFPTDQDVLSFMVFWW